MLAKPRYGVVPRVVGLSLARARAKLERRGFDVVVRGGSGGKVVAQTPRAGRAAGRGMRITLTVRHRAARGG